MTSFFTVEDSKIFNFTGQHGQLFDRNVAISSLFAAVRRQFSTSSTVELDRFKQLAIRDPRTSIQKLSLKKNDGIWLITFMKTNEIAKHLPG